MWVYIKIAHFSINIQSSNNPLFLRVSEISQKIGRIWQSLRSPVFATDFSDNLKFGDFPCLFFTF